ncbi:MMPL family transporter [Streptomyces sp. URMC 123]|uniref:MMPL family transporter n=1 Tax=Streptomyces sp. URMC 123 TaxID=3423403 RepID=UPI003F1BA1F7
MARLLYRLGRFCSRHRMAVIIGWLVLLAVAVTGVVASGGRTNDEFRVPGTESQHALDVLSDRLPAASGTSAQIVFEAPPGGTVTGDKAKAAIGRTLVAAADAPQVAAVVDPFATGTVSEDHRVALAQVRYSVTRDELADDSVDALEETTAAARDAGLRVLVGGNAFSSTGVEVSAKELIGVAVALIVLLVTFGSALAAGLTLLPALLGVGVGLAALLSLTELITLSSTAPTLALMLGLAVGIDYALFILSRHRSQLAEGEAVPESIGRATGTAGSAVVFAGLTVVIAMAGLAVVRIPFITIMGLAASLTVTVAVAIAVTLLPALMGLAGERLRPGPSRRQAKRGDTRATGPGSDSGSGEAAPEAPGGGARPPLGVRWARAVTARPLLTVLLVVLGLGAVAVPAKDLSLALPDNGSAAPHTSQRQAYDLVSRSFGPGFNGPLLVVVTPDGADRGETGAARGQRLRQAATEVGTALGELPNVKVASPPQLNPDNDLAIVQIVPGTGPTDEKTRDLVHDIRDRAGALEKRTGTELAVTGSTAASIDVSDRLAGALLPFACVVVGLALVLLLLVFRSVLVPVKAAIGFLLSVGAAFGVVVAVFQWGWLADALGVHTTGPVISFLPIIVIAVLFGLAMDYEVFLVSAIREDYVHSGRAHDAVLAGFKHSARVVTAAALIMFSVFASFAASEDAIVKPMALALAVGVLVDAFVVRMTLVPAVLALAGDRAWWLPRRLDRVLPHVDVEGASLDRPEPAAPARVPVTSEAP